jgi:hypothetical protein
MDFPGWFHHGANRRKPPLLINPTLENHLYLWIQPEKKHLLVWSKPEKATFMFSQVWSSNKGGFLQLGSPIKMDFPGWFHQ